MQCSELISIAGTHPHRGSQHGKRTLQKVGLEREGCLAGHHALCSEGPCGHAVRLEGHGGACHVELVEGPDVEGS